MRLVLEKADRPPENAPLLMGLKLNQVILDKNMADVVSKSVKYVMEQIKRLDDEAVQCKRNAGKAPLLEKLK